MIYIHTSMFPGQLNEPVSGSDEIATFATELIEAAQIILSRREHEVRSVVFPLFMAGFATKERLEKQMVLDLLLAVEAGDYKGSTESTRNLLRRIYEKQETDTRKLGVDWLEEVQNSGQIFIM